MVNVRNDYRNRNDNDNGVRVSHSLIKICGDVQKKYFHRRKLSLNGSFSSSVMKLGIDVVGLNFDR